MGMQMHTLLTQFCPPPDLAYINILPGFSKFSAAIQIPCSEFKKNW